jgi:peptidoglycan/xylan/chitin deacetylase (PgdA/CDA1 family)
MPNIPAVPILMYHKVGFRAETPADRHLNVPTARFRSHMRILSALGYTGVTLADCIAAFRGEKELPRRPVCVTFDDGFRCVFTEAAPVLRELSWPATVFVPSAYMGAPGGWEGIKEWSPEPIMRSDELRDLLRAGWEAGGHTQTHCDLSALDDAAALAEIAGGARDLSNALQTDIRTFAYPYGRLNDRTPALVREAGLQCAVTVVSGRARPDDDPYLLPRVKVASRDGAVLFLYRLLLRGRLSKRGAGSPGPLNAHD